MTQVANNLGWEVQQHSDDAGWTPVTGPFPDRVQAYKELELYTVFPELRYRVYESPS